MRVAISEEGGSGRETLEADYLVGCDGARSLTREQIGIERGGADFDQLWCSPSSARKNCMRG